MTDEPAEPELFEEASTPGRSMTGAAEDLSSLFGEEAGRRDPAATALGPRRTPAPPSGDVGGQLGVLGQRLANLEEELNEAVARIQGVDRHLATTFQGLQAIFDRLQESPGPAAEVAAGFTALGERLGAVEAQMKQPSKGSDPELTARLTSIEHALASAVDRLAGLDERLSTTLAHAEAGREAVGGLAGTLAEMRAALEAAPAPVAAPEVLAQAPPTEEPVPPAAQAESADTPPRPDLESEPAAEGGVGEPGEAVPPGDQQDALYWEATANEAKPSMARPEPAPDSEAQAAPPQRPPFWRPAEPSP